MTFSPILPTSGYTGWRFLQSTLAKQQETLSKTQENKREIEYFEKKILTIKSPQDIIDDRTLLKIALGSVGLQDDLKNKAFIKKVLESDPSDAKSFANKLSNKKYKELLEAFGSASIKNLQKREYIKNIEKNYIRNTFESAVGEKDNNLRLALNIKSAIENISKSTTNESSKWFNLMGDAPLRQVIEGALGLPTAISKIDIDQQKKSFTSKALSTLGVKKFDDLNDAEIQEKIIKIFLTRAEASKNTFSGLSIALQLIAR